MRSNPSALGSITILRKHERQAARPPSSFLSPLATIFKRIVGKRPLELERFLGWRIHPDVDLLPRRQNDGDCFRVDSPDLVVRLGRQKREVSFVVSASFTFRTEVQRVQMPPVGIQSKLQF
jgi:hypothetical protein